MPKSNMAASNSQPGSSISGALWGIYPLQACRSPHKGIKSNEGPWSLPRVINGLAILLTDAIYTVDIAFSHAITIVGHLVGLIIKFWPMVLFSTLLFC